VIKILDSEIPNSACVSSDAHTFTYCAGTEVVRSTYDGLTRGWQNSLLHIPGEQSVACPSERVAASASRGSDKGCEMFVITPP